MSSFWISHHGCEPTGFDTARIASDLQSLGFKQETESAQADFLIFLGCTFTKQKEDELQQRIAELKAGEKSGEVIISGCYLKSQASVPGVNFVRTKEIVDFLRPRLTLPVIQARTQSTHSGESSERTIVAVSDGCYGSCTFCSIKTVRGRHRSRPMSDILSNIQSGMPSKRVKLTGIEVAGYGLDIGMTVGDLIREVKEAFPEIEIELGSLNPKLLCKMTETDLAMLGDPKVTGNIHLPIESASTSVLREMQRGYTAEQYQVLWAKLEELGVRNFSTDLIAGFPTETDTDHQANLRFLATHPLAFCQIFTFEPRPGTEAEKFPQLPRPKRVERTLELIAEYTMNYASSHGIDFEEIISGAVQLPLNSNLDLRSEI